MKETYIIQVISTQNATWQGTVTWAEGARRETFRSALELLRLMDSVLTEDEGGEKSEQENRKKGGARRHLRGTP